MKPPGAYTLSNGKTVRIVSAELVSESVQVIMEEPKDGPATDAHLGTDL